MDLDIPPLRKRREDIPDLVGHLLRDGNMELGTNVQEVTPRAMEALITYDWPGNIRELKHTLERALILCDDPAIDLIHLPQEISQRKAG